MQNWRLKPKHLVFIPLLFLALAIACGTSATPAPTAAPAGTVAPGATAVPTAKAAATPAPTTIAKAKLERLRIALAPSGFDTYFTWLQNLSGMIDKRPALESLIGVDRNTSEYIPELADQWDMAPNGEGWTIALRRGTKFVDSEKDWGEFTARDVRHAVFLITQPDSVATSAGDWRSWMGITKTDTE